MRQLTTFIVAAACAAFAPLAAVAQTGKWPDRPVKVIIPFAPGGPNDMIGRIWTDRLGQAFGQPFVVDNRGGATGLIGTEAVVRSAPDGYTLLFASTSVLAASMAVRRNGIDPTKQLTATARVGDLISALALHPSVPVNNIEEYKAYVRKNPGKLAHSTSGVGSQHHLLIELMRVHAGLDVLHVPYRGTAEGMRDLLAGNVHQSIDSTYFGQPGVKLKYISVLLNERLPEHPDLPTFVEAGLMPLVMVTWYGIYGPAGLPAEIASAINAKVAEIGKQPEILKLLRGRGALLKLNSPEETAASLAEQYEANKALGKKLNIQTD